MQKTIYIPIDISIKKTVECNQLIKRGDTLVLQVKVFNNAALTDLQGQSIDLILKKADNTLIEKTITGVANSIITATLDVQATIVPGEVTGEVQIYDASGQGGTNTFTFIVDSSLADDVLAKSQDSIETLAQLKNTITDGNTAIQKYKENVTVIAGTAEAVEALNGTKNYIDINLSTLQNENAKAVVNIKDEKTQNDRSDINIPELKSTNTNAETLKATLEVDIINGETLDSDLKVDIAIGNTLKTNLETDISTGTTLKTNLETDIATGNTLKNNIDVENVRAEANIAAMKNFGDVTQVTQNLTVLKSEVESARGTEVNLDARLDKFDASLSENTQNLAQLSKPSYLLNDNFQVCQRSTGDFTNPANWTYLYDRWIISSASNNLFTKTLTGIKWVASGDGKLRQMLESNDWKNLLGKTVTISIKFKGTCSVNLGEFGIVGGFNVTSNTTTFANYDVLTFTNTVPQTLTGNLTVSIANPSTTLEIEYIKLEIGSKATPFVPRLYAEELSLCQRYYQIIYNYRKSTIIPDVETLYSNIMYFTKMRVSPSIDTSCFDIYYGWAKQEGFIKTPMVFINSFVLDCKKMNNGLTDVGKIMIVNNKQIALDAEIY